MQTFSINQWNCKSTFQAVPWHVSIIFINVFIVNVAVISPVKLQHVALKVIFVFAADHVSCCRRPPCRFQGRRRCEGGSGSRSPPAENNQHRHVWVQHCRKSSYRALVLSVNTQSQISSKGFGFTVFFLILRTTVLLSAGQLCDWLGHLSVKQTHLDIFFLDPWRLFIGRLIVLDLCVQRRWAEITFHLFGVVVKRIHFCLLISFNHL